jgi:hypothetical protein
LRFDGLSPTGAHWRVGAYSLLYSAGGKHSLPALNPIHPLIPLMKRGEGDLRIVLPRPFFQAAVSNFKSEISNSKRNSPQPTLVPAFKSQISNLKFQIAVR